jgi:hypothetical protein
MTMAEAEAAEVTQIQCKGDSNNGGNVGGKRQWRGQQWQGQG